MLTTIQDAKAWAALCNAKILQEGSHPIKKITIDSRNDCKDALFIALKGTRTDGHVYLTAAIRQGAVAILVSDIPTPLPTGVTVLLVRDTKLALQEAAEKWKNSVAPLCIAITGSVGKTTTKEILYSILQSSAPTFATPENFNTEIGVPLSVLSMPRGVKYLICEFGMRARGEIAYLSRLLKPDMGIITCIGSSHLETLGSRQAIAEAKMELLCGMPAGTILYDGEEPLLLPLRDCKARSIAVYRSQVIKLGMHASKTNFSYGGACYTVQGIGEHLLYDCALACTAARLLGLDQKEIREGLQSFHPASGRQEVRALRDGITLICDHYNASPESMEAAIQVLSELATGRMITILGGMLELGASSPDFHESIGRILAARSISMLWCIGEEAKDIARGARIGKMEQTAIHQVPANFAYDQLANEIVGALLPGDTILLKASRKFQFEKLAIALIDRLAE